MTVHLESLAGWHASGLPAVFRQSSWEIHEVISARLGPLALFPSLLLAQIAL
jgi:hypothetical protein